MTTYVALLRGINLGPRNKIAMAELREVAGSLGHSAVRTHILSGNVIFASNRRSAARLETEIEGAGVTTTTRNWNTVSKLLELATEPPKRG